jgi:TonB family protein
VLSEVAQAVFHLSLTIDKAGIPRNVPVTEGYDPKFDKKAIEIASSFRFKPGEKDGQPVDVPANFDLAIGRSLYNVTAPRVAPVSR